MKTIGKISFTSDNTTDITESSLLSLLSQIRAFQLPSELKIPEWFAPFSSLAHSLSRAWAKIMRGALAPLRKIVSRELEIYSSYRNGHPESFAVHDRMECGHVHTSLLWDIFDLLNAYTDNPEVGAKRHRCQPCASLLATRKQPKSVTVVKAAVA